MSYQWFKGVGDNRVAIEGATSATYSVASAMLEDAGSYSVDASNEAGTATSAFVALSVLEQIGATVFFEDFDDLPFGPNVDEGVAGDEVWTDTPPAGWSLDNSLMVGLDNPETDGVTEWAGWGFAKRDWWVQTAGDQQRSEFTKSTGGAAIADADEWDDLAHDNPTLDTFLLTPEIDLSKLQENTAVLRFSSAFRPYANMLATFEASYDGGATFSEIIRWESDATSPNFKPDTAESRNETVTIPLTHSVDSSVIFKFGLTQAGNDWYWAIDNIEVAGVPALIYSEDFSSVALGPNVDEGVAGDNVWSKQGPEGWTSDDSGVPGVGNPDMDGVTEWEGWSFADRAWWVETAGDQQRSGFTKGEGAILVIDPDEWDDLAHEDGELNTFITSADIDIAGVAENSLVFRFDSTWRPYDQQTGTIMANFDNGSSVEILRWESDEASPFFKSDATEHRNETVTIPVPNPEGASTVSFTFGLENGGNDWFWAIDNLELSFENSRGPVIVSSDPIEITGYSVLDGQITLTWTGGSDAEFVIWSSPSVGIDADWQEAFRGAGNSATITIDGDSAFYQVIQE